MSDASRQRKSDATLLLPLAASSHQSCASAGIRMEQRVHRVHLQAQSQTRKNAKSVPLGLPLPMPVRQLGSTGVRLNPAAGGGVSVCCRWNTVLHRQCRVDDNHRYTADDAPRASTSERLVQSTLPRGTIRNRLRRGMRRRTHARTGIHNGVVPYRPVPWVQLPRPTLHS